MIGAVAWKEYREHRSFWIVLAGGTAALLAVMMQVFAPGSPWAQSFHDPHILTVVAAFVMTGMYGLVCGGMMIAGERESKAIPFLDNLPASRASLWWAKMLVGSGFTLLHGLATILIVRLLGLDEAAQLPRWWVGLLPLVAFECYCWGLCLSAACKSVLSAITLAAMLPLVGIWLVCTGMFFAAPPLLVAVRLFLVLIALAVSLSLFTSRDWEKRFGLSLAPARGDTAPRRPPLAWEAILWVAWQQGRIEMAVALLLGVAGGLILPAAILPIWLLVGLVIGAICGAAVLSGEQAERANRLFGDQRLPVGKIWRWKTGFWLGTALAALGVMAAVATVRGRSSPDGGGIEDLGPFVDNLLGPEMGPGRLLGVAALALVGVLTGFGFGQFTSLVWRKGAVAVVVAVIASAGAISIWVPSLLAGGVPPWQLLVMPLSLLTASRMAQWAWSAERLHSTGPMARLLAGCGFGLLWAAGSFLYRAYEPPHGDDPFDLPAFRAKLTDITDEPVGPILRQVVQNLNESLPQTEGEPAPRGPGVEAAIRGPGGGDGPPPPRGPVRPGMEMVGRGAMDRERRPDPMREQRLREITRVIEEGWRPENEALAKWLDEACRGKWPALLREATDHEPVRLFDPRVGGRSIPELDAYQMAASILAGRALQRQAAGAHEEALDHLQTLLALSRHLQHMAPPSVYRVAIQMETSTLQAMGHWLHGLGRRPELARKALVALSRHEDRLPPVVDTLKIQYHLLRRGLEDDGSLPEVGRDAWGEGRLDTESLGLVVITPWEQARARRLVNEVYAGRLRAAEVGYVPAFSGQAPRTAAEALLGDWLMSPSLPSDARERLGELLERSWVRGYLPRTEGLQRLILLHLARVRAARLQAALLCFELTKGRPAAALDDLTPEFLAELPADPFRTGPFHYRLSEGEPLLWPPVDGEGRGGRVVRPIAAGRGVLWSTGPDCQDNGGTKQWDRDDKPEAESDLIFLVPKPS